MGRARGLGYDEEDDVEAIKAMLIDPANSLDGLAVRCIADPTPVREEDEVWLADGFLTGAHHHAATYQRPRDQALANAVWHLTVASRGSKKPSRGRISLFWSSFWSFGPAWGPKVGGLGPRKRMGAWIGLLSILLSILSFPPISIFM